MKDTEQDKDFLKTLTVLYVEDDDISRGLLSQLLERSCAKLLQAKNGSEGIDLFSAHRPDIVITDVQMPGMDGLAMAEKIRSIDADIPIIITTAFEDTDYLERSIEIGIDKYVLKPIMRERLQSALLDCVRRLRLEDEQRKVAERLHQAEKNEAIGELASGVAHHFNNILQIISGYSGIALMNISEDDPNRKCLNVINEAASRAASITQGLLAFSCKQPIKPKETDINEIIHQLETSIRALIGDTINLKVSLYDKPVLCNVDSEQIGLVVKNLAHNAKNAMPAGGILSLEISLIEIDEAFIKTHGYGESGLYALISMSDNGIGMDSETLRRIFNPFYTTREVGQGTGLGLPMSLGIIKTHNGFLNVYSEPGHGTTIRIYLPVTNSPLKQQSTDISKEIPPGGTETILVVDDSTDMLNFTSHLLNKFGYQVLAADSGRKAIELFTNNRDDIGLIVTDMFINNMTGMELADEIRQVEPEAKFLYLSGYSNEIIQSSGELKAGEELISKPFRPSDFLKKVRDILDTAYLIESLP